MWYLVGLVWIAVMIFIVSRYTRKQRRRGAERATEMAALLANLKANPKAALEGLEKTAAPVVSAAGPAFNRKARLLPQPAALLYYVFRTGLPDHEIFAGMALSDVVDVGASAASGGQREQLARRLAQQRLDLVVCNKQLEVVAAVMVNNSTSAAPADALQFAIQCLQDAGIRALSIDPAAPPRHHQVHALIYG